LRMLEQYLGPDVFRDGIRAYVKRHEFANTETVDLWAALGRASRQPIPEVMDGWIFRPGFPLVSARLDGNALVLSQQRFTYLPTPFDGVTASATPPVQPATSTWQVPLRVRISAGGATHTQSILLSEAETRLPVPAGLRAVLVNDGGHGFYRVRYTPDLL